MLGRDVLVARYFKPRQCLSFAFISFLLETFWPSMALGFFLFFFLPLVDARRLG